MRRVLVLGLLLAAAPAPAADWPRFRGPNGDGAADGPLPSLSDRLWVRELAGGGNSSPIIHSGKLFIQSAKPDGSGRTLECLNPVTGEVEWVKTRDGGRAHVHAKNSLASATPAADSERVYAVFWDGSKVSLAAFTHAGGELWQKQLGGYVSQHGPGFSPVAHAGRVYVNYDQDGAAELVCFDGKSGEKLWAKPRKPFRACYSCPLVRELEGGTTEIVNASTAGVTGYDAATGKVNWNHDWAFTGQALRTVASPILAGGLVLAPSGDGGGSRDFLAVRPGPDAKDRVAWQRRKDTPYVPGPVALDKHVYWVTDAGSAACAELATGKQVWSERLFAKPVSASLVRQGDRVLACCEDGKLAAFQATPAGFEKLDAADLAEPIFATPALADGRLFVRTTGKLYCYGPKAGAKP